MLDLAFGSAEAVAAEAARLRIEAAMMNVVRAEKDMDLSFKGLNMPTPSHLVFEP